LVVADAETSPFADEAFDLVVSLLDLHAANDPVGALVQALRSLKPDGLFVAVMFGASTLAELRTALGEAEVATTGGLSPRVFPFADVRDAGTLLQRAGFALPVADEDRLVVRYADPSTLLTDIRGAGESNVLNERRRRFLRRDTLKRAMEIYGERFVDSDRVRATFSLVALTGWRPHESQPKALKPGSGRVSLAEALKPPIR
jgi:SAM-dependent methyltransferase